MNWPQQKLSEIISSALAEGFAVAEPSDGSARTAAKLRWALYRQASRQGVTNLAMRLAGASVVLETMTQEEVKLQTKGEEYV